MTCADTHNRRYTVDIYFSNSEVQIMLPILHSVGFNSFVKMSSDLKAMSILKAPFKPISLDFSLPVSFFLVFN